MKKKNIRGYTVHYKEDAEKGISHLSYVLSLAEADSLFRNARYSGRLKFEDRLGRNFTLISHTNGSFTVEKR
jgi:hypothetical protein